MRFNDFNSLDITAILYLILGIANLIAGKYIAGLAWTSLSLSQILVQRIGSWHYNMFRWERPEVILAWITYLIFAFSILYYFLSKLFPR